MVDDRLIAFSSTFALLCAVILARVVFMRQPRRLVLAGVTLLPGGASGWYILIAGQGTCGFAIGGSGEEPRAGRGFSAFAAGM